MDSIKKSTNIGLAHCGVPQCNTYRSEKVSMYHIPKLVMENSEMLRSWSNILKMGKQFPKNFLICSQHFREEDILRPIRLSNIRYKTKLKAGVFPSLCLPKSSIVSKEKAERRKLPDRTVSLNTQNIIQDNLELEVETDPINFVNVTTVGVQCEEPILCNKAVQANAILVNITSLWNTDGKLNTMTGIPSIKMLNTLTDICQEVRGFDKYSMSMKDRILLTMHKLKSNCTFAELAVGFEICDKTSKIYFADTIQLLAYVIKNIGLIHWQSREENSRSLPHCFHQFSNVRTVLDCTEIKTVKHRCLTCRMCTYSHYKGTHTLKVLIGVAPSGSINYVSKVATGKSSDKAIFNLTDLIGKFEPGDAVMVDKGFLIAEELANAGVELIRPEFHFENFSKADVEKNTKIASARVHVERRFARIKAFRILSDKVGLAVLPYIDDILIVLCGLSNIFTPILKDDKFV